MTLSLECSHDVPAVVNKTDYGWRNAKLREGMKKVEDLVGLDCVKNQIYEFICSHSVRTKAEAFGLISSDSSRSYHMAFIGNPGSGKTETARCFPDILFGLGIIESTKFFEVNRSSLVGRYIGETENITREILQEAINYGGVLFIDEFHQLIVDDSPRDYGKNVINTLVSYLENYRNKFVCVAAGYPKEMEQAINSDPGLKSRFSIFLNFPDYTTDELISIFKMFSTRNSRFIEQIDAAGKFGDLFIVDSKVSESMYSLLTEEIKRLNKIYPAFGNGRAMRKLYEIAERVQAVRIFENHMKNGEKINQDEFIMDFIMFTEDDLQKAFSKLEEELKAVSEAAKSNPIGFHNH